MSGGPAALAAAAAIQPAQEQQQQQRVNAPPVFALHSEFLSQRRWGRRPCRRAPIFSSIFCTSFAIAFLCLINSVYCKTEQPQLQEHNQRRYIAPPAEQSQLFTPHQLNIINSQHQYNQQQKEEVQNNKEDQKREEQRGEEKQREEGEEKLLQENIHQKQTQIIVDHSKILLPFSAYERALLEKALAEHRTEEEEAATKTKTHFEAEKQKKRKDGEEEGETNSDSEEKRKPEQKFKKEGEEEEWEQIKKNQKSFPEFSGSNSGGGDVSGGDEALKEEEKLLHWNESNRPVIIHLPAYRHSGNNERKEEKRFDSKRTEQQQQLRRRRPNGEEFLLFKSNSDRRQNQQENQSSRKKHTTTAAISTTTIRPQSWHKQSRASAERSQLITRPKAMFVPASTTRHISQQQQQQKKQRPVQPVQIINNSPSSSPQPIFVPSTISKSGEKGKFPDGGGGGGVDRIAFTKQRIPSSSSPIEMVEEPPDLPPIVPVNQRQLLQMQKQQKLLEQAALFERNGIAPPPTGATLQQPLASNDVNKLASALLGNLFPGSGNNEVNSNPPPAPRMAAAPLLGSPFDLLSSIGGGGGAAATNGGGGGGFSGAAPFAGVASPSANPLLQLLTQGSTIEQITAMTRNLLQMTNGRGVGNSLPSLMSTISGGGPQAAASKLTSSAVTAALQRQQSSAAASPTFSFLPSATIVEESLLGGTAGNGSGGNSKIEEMEKYFISNKDVRSRANFTASEIRNMTSAEFEEKAAEDGNGTFSMLSGFPTEQRMILAAAVRNGELDPAQALKLLTAENAGAATSAINKLTSDPEFEKTFFGQLPPKRRLVNAESRLLEWIQQNRPRVVDTSNEATASKNTTTPSSLTTSKDWRSSSRLATAATAASEKLPYYGRYCGSFVEQEAENGTNSHNIAGAVWAVDERHLLITKFRFTPLFQSENITFWAGPAKLIGSVSEDLFPSENGFFVPAQVLDLNNFNPNEIQSIEARVRATEPKQQQTSTENEKIVAKHQTTSANEESTTPKSQVENTTSKNNNKTTLYRAPAEREEDEEDDWEDLRALKNATKASTVMKRMRRNLYNQLFGAEMSTDDVDYLVASANNDINSSNISISTQSPENEEKKQTEGKVENEAKSVVVASSGIVNEKVSKVEKTHENEERNSTNEAKSVVDVSSGIVNEKVSKVEKTHEDEERNSTNEATTKTTKENTEINLATTKLPVQVKGTPQGFSFHFGKRKTEEKDEKEQEPCSNNTAVAITKDNMDQKKWQILGWNGIGGVQQQQQQPQTLLLTLPTDRLTTSLDWLAVWDHGGGGGEAEEEEEEARKKEALAVVLFPKGFALNQIPSTVQLRAFPSPAIGISGLRILQSGPIRVLDTKTIEVTEFTLRTDGQLPAWFMVGKEIMPNSKP